MKRFFSIALAFTVLLTTMAMSSYSSYAKTQESANYEYEEKSDGTIVLTKYTGNEMEVVIPERIDGKTVSEIGSQVFSPVYKDFSYVDNIRAVSVPKSITSIGYRNFVLLPMLKYIKVDKDNPVFCSVNGVLFSKDMKTILCYPSSKSGDFYRIPETVELIELDSFRSSQFLQEVKIGKKVKEIKERAFLDCLSMQHIVIPKNVEKIGRFAIGSRTVVNTTAAYDNEDDALYEGIIKTNAGYIFFVPIEGFEVYARKGTAAHQYCKDRENYSYGPDSKNWKNIEFVKIPLKRPVIKKLVNEITKYPSGRTRYSVIISGKSYNKPFTYSWNETDVQICLKNKTGTYIERYGNSNNIGNNGNFKYHLDIGKPKGKQTIKYRAVMKICGYELKTQWSKSKSFRFKKIKTFKIN